MIAIATDASLLTPQQDFQQRFWFWHLLYWLAYLLVKYTHLATLVPMQKEQSWPYLLIYTGLTLVNFCFTGYLGWRDLQLNFSVQQQLRRLVRVLLPLTVLLIPIRQLLVVNFASNSGDSYMTHWSQYFVVAIPLVLLPIVGWIAIYLLLKMQHANQQEFLHQQELLLQARCARLKVLRYQLNPHFMFNTLNALNALIVARQGVLAEQLIQDLSVFLRHSLQNQDDQRVPLQQEMAALNAYLAIQQVRFGARFVLEWQLDAPKAKLRLPPLLFQPLAENAVLYSVAEHSGPIKLKISLNSQQQQLVLQISSLGEQPGNTEIWDKTDQPVSLQQLAERLELLFGQQATLTLYSPQHGFFGRLSLPLEPLYATDPTGDRR